MEQILSTDLLAMGPLGAAMTIAHLVVIFGFVLVERGQPTSKLAWLLALVFLPGVGLAAWLVLGPRRRVRRARRRSLASGRAVRLLAGHRGLAEGAVQAAQQPQAQALLRLGTRLSTTPPSRGNRCTLLIDARDTYDALLADIAAATHHVHLLYYIIQPDEEGRRLRDALVQRAAQGVQVRVLVDGLGSFALPPDFWDPLRRAGGQASVFGPLWRPLRFLLRGRLDFRNHRKIAVIDGRIGFCGGVNIGREYLGLDPEIGHWRDTHLRIEGPAAIGLQTVFAMDWHSVTEQALSGPQMFPPPSAEGVGESVVHIVDSGPDQHWSPVRHIYAQALALATQRVWLTSPYFVPDALLLQSMVGAALRGIDVRLLVPSRSDSVLVSWASQSYYAELLEAGVRVYEYRRFRRGRKHREQPPGMVHAKTMVVDNWLATVGSTNMDLRSFELNFEIDALVYGDLVGSALARQFERDIGHAARVHLKDVEAWGYFKRLLTGTARLLSPLL